jgi:hypothetical protein
MNFSIKAEFIGWAAEFCAKVGRRDDRILENLLIEPHPNGGVLVVGCDGHSAGVFYDQHGHASEAFCMERPSPPMISACTKKTSGIEKRVMKEEDSEIIRVSTVDREMQPRTTLHIATEQISDPDHYPRWRSFFRGMSRANREKIIGTVYPLEAMKKFCFKGDTDRDGIQFFPSGYDQPIYVMLNGKSWFAGVTMPIMESSYADEPSDIFSQWWFKGLGINDNENDEFALDDSMFGMASAKE